MGYSKKFTVGFERIQGTDGAKSLMDEIGEYLETLRTIKIKDKELRLVQRVRNEYKTETMVFMYGLTHLLVFLVTLPLSFPGLLLNTPIMYLSRR